MPQSSVNGLPAHLRFDSLVETEVFLSQEDNRWIEDFSRGSTGIEFRASEAESCSISRRNNVWSEATSSESVEMLLKSVGQEEMLPETVPGELNNCDELGYLTRQMETKHIQEDQNDEYVTDSNASIPQDEFLENLTGLNVERQLPQMEGTTQIQENMISAHKKSSHLGLTDATNRCTTSITEGNVLVDREYADEIGREAKFSVGESNSPVDKSLDCKTGDDSHQPARLLDTFNCSVELRNSETLQPASDLTSESVDGLIEGASCDRREQNVSTREAQTEIQILEETMGEASIYPVESSICLGSNVKSALLGGAVEISPESVRESGMSTRCETQLQGQEESAKDVCCTTPEQPGKVEVQNLPVRERISHPFRDGHNESSLIDVREQHAVEIDSVNAGYCASPRLKIDCAMQLSYREDNDQLGDVPEGSYKKNGEVSVNTLEPSTISENSIQKSVRSNKAPEDESSDLAAPSAGRLICEQTETESEKIGIATSRIDTEQPSEKAHCSTAVYDSSGQVFEEKVDFRHANAGPPDAGKSTSDDGVIIHGLKPEMAAKIETVNGDSHFGKSLNPTIVNDCTKEESKQLSGSGSCHLYNEDGTAVKMPTDASLSSMMANEVDTQLAIEVDAASVVKISVANNAAGADTTGKSPPVIETYNGASRSGPLSLTATCFGEPYSKESNTHPNPNEQFAKEDDDTGGAICGGNREEEVMKSECENTSVQAADSHRTACDSSTIINSNELSQCNRGDQVEGRGSEVVEGSSPAGPGNMASHQISRGSDSEIMCGTSKSTSERRGRRGSGKGTLKEKNKVVNHAKVTTPENSKFANPTSNLPDLNSSALNNSAAPSMAFHQPFNDMQQVQLRAQIFVYGSLIQGTAPDETCMVAAFGLTDGGRSLWEPVWQTTVERVLNQKHQFSTAESPLQSQSGARAHDLANKQGSHQCRLLPPSVSRSSSKPASATIVNPIVTSSPLLTVPASSHDCVQPCGMQRGPIMDSQQAMTWVLHPYQTPPMRNLSSNTSWPLHCPFPGAWVAAPQTLASDASARFLTAAITETVKLTPVKDSAGSSASGVKLVTSSPPVHSGVPVPDAVQGMLSPEHQLADPKPRKRKKVPPSNDLTSISEPSQAQTEPTVDSVTAHTASLVATTAPTWVTSKIDNGKSAGIVFPICPAYNLEKGEMNAGMIITCSEKTLTNVAEAKLQAEDAASHAATAVNQLQGVWSQLAKQREAGLTSEAEAKLASAAVAIAAAASVAKAATAAAKIASNAALQAKLMADEAFLSCRKSSESSFKDVHNIGKATPASILRGDDVTNKSISILVAAKEAAKRRIEAASAASKQAENLDAIVKAAELAAEAVSQAGKIVAMGDSLPLKELIEGGPEGYWKLPQASSELAVKFNKNREINVADNTKQGADISAKVSGNGMPHQRGPQAMNHGKTPSPRDMSNNSLDDHNRLADGNSSSILDGQETRRHKSSKAFEMSESNKKVSKVETSSRTSTSRDEHDVIVDNMSENAIKEGCLVEVWKDGDGFKSGWFSAKVLTVKDGKAYVSYNDIISEDDSGNLKELVSLEGDGDKAPKIRVGFPLSGLQFKGTKKRRKAMCDNVWSVGDRIDALIKDCWCEGIIREKNEKEEMTFTAHFPVCGETSVVKGWQLRPSRIWAGGKWVEWSHSAECRSCCYQGDKVRFKNENAVTDKLLDLNPKLGKPVESKLLALSDSEKVFKDGRSSQEDNELDAPRTLRTGLKEGSRVIFGVPKPHKKRKFMEVSKHYHNGSGKFAKYSQPTMSHGWRNASKCDSEETQPSESEADFPRKCDRIPGRIVPLQRGDLTKSVEARGVVHTERDHEKDVKDSGGHENLMENFSLSVTEGAAEGPLSSLLAHRANGSSKILEYEQVSKRKVAPSGGKLTKIEEDKISDRNSSKSVSEIVEPRRSNRRIQPTHRLLEGLQSASIISKMPPSQEKGHRNHPSGRGK
ncbi:hypothetical protein Nepgr_031687 [Nepenthes gracilis]|uniref:Agenet domain-containing protein n=1 Tax=Nepenthes gracilis TaxID=150966 RepID=A0AAD3TIM0_NEPGR|nr:hypothetical protein Nepgr_031687 [Nepenthes gracilis]